MTDEIKVLTEKADLEAELKEAGDKTVVVDFYADWCGPCRALAPKLKAMKKSAEYSHVHFLKVDADEAEALGAEYKIDALPTLVLFKHGEEKGRIVGASEDRLKKMIEEVSAM